MQPFKLLLFSTTLFVGGMAMADGVEKPTPYSTPASQWEKLDRGLVRVNTSSTSAVLSWRMLGTDDRINGGHEYLTVFEGLTGRAIHTIAYNPNRNNPSQLYIVSTTTRADRVYLKRGKTVGGA